LKKVLHIITLSETGGAQKIVYFVTTGLKDGFDVTVLTSPGGEMIEWLRNKKVNVYELKELCRRINIYKDLVSFVRILLFIKRNKFDIVHCHSWKGGVLGRLAAILAGVPEVYFTVHGWSILNTSKGIIHTVYLLIEKLLGYYTSKIICVCDSDRDMGIRLKVAKRDKFTVIYNGIEDCKIKEVEKRKLLLPEGSIVAGTVARMAKPKMVYETAHIMEKLFEKYNNLYFIWIGDGPLFDCVKKYVESKGIEKRFIMVGKQEDVFGWLSCFDIYILLSRYEGLPVSILEAMSAALPVIASDTGGVSELVFNDVNGFLVNDCIQDIEEKISLLIQNEEKRKAFGAAGRSIFCSRFTVDKMLEGYKRLYEENKK